MTERERFEAWALAHGETGDYKNTRAGLVWIGWQAAMASGVHRPDPANAPTGQIRLNTDKTVVVDKSYHYRKIDASTQRGGKLQLVNRYAGVAAYGNYNPAYSFWTHYAPLPTFDPKEI
jgi:hypothetical protein